MVRQSAPSSMGNVISDIVARLDAANRARDEVLTDGRRIVRLSANSIRAMHRGDIAGAASHRADAARLLESIRVTTLAHPALYWSGHVQDAMKEFAEAAIVAALLEHRPIPDPIELQIEDAPYLNGLVEAASELRRDALDVLRSDDIERAVEILGWMDDLYGLAVTIDFPDALTGGLRRSTDQLRAVLERTRGDLTVALRQHRLEQAIAAISGRVGDATQS